MFRRNTRTTTDKKHYDALTLLRDVDYFLLARELHVIRYRDLPRLKKTSGDSVLSSFILFNNPTLDTLSHGD